MQKRVLIVQFIIHVLFTRAYLCAQRENIPAGLNTWPLVSPGSVNQYLHEFEYLHKLELDQYILIYKQAGAVPV